MDIEIRSSECWSNTVYLFEIVGSYRTGLHTVSSARAAANDIQFAGRERFRWTRDAVDERSVRWRCSGVRRCVQLLQKHDVTRPVDGQIERCAQFIDVRSGRRCPSRAPWRSRKGPDCNRNETARSTFRPSQTSFKHVNHSQTSVIQNNARRSPLDPPEIVYDRVDYDWRGNCSRFDVVKLCQFATRRRRRCPWQHDGDAVYVGDQAENEASNLWPMHGIGPEFRLPLLATLGYSWLPLSFAFSTCAAPLRRPLLAKTRRRLRDRN